MKKETKSPKTPSALLSIVPLVVLIGLMFGVVQMFGGNSLAGPSQLALLAATGISMTIATLVCHVRWAAIEKQIQQTIGSTSVAILVLLVIGMLSGSWMISGVVPTMVCYGIELMSPKFFLLCTCLICSIVSVITGSSWTTVATIGVALMCIGTALGVPNPWTAGAIISGAYFGDKISPLSDTTILAASTCEVPLFTHVRYMLGTTVPSMILTLVIFAVAGFLLNPNGDIDASVYSEGLRSTFNISPLTFIVPIFTILLIARKVPSLVTLFLASMAAAIYALIAQPEVLASIGGGSSFGSIVKGDLIALFGSTSLSTGTPELDSLVSTRGMAGMLNTVWLILCALVFGAVMLASGMLQSITNLIIRGIRNTVGLVSSTVATGIIMNLTTCDQYLSIILTGNMFREAYHQQGCENRLLSRTTEDAATVTSVLIPWNSCGMTQATVLGIATTVYMPYCFFNLISPLMSIAMSIIGRDIAKHIPPQPADKGSYQRKHCGTCSGNI